MQTPNCSVVFCPIGTVSINHFKKLYCIWCTWSRVRASMLTSTSRIFGKKNCVQFRNGSLKNHLSSRSFWSAKPIREIDELSGDQSWGFKRRR